MKQLFLLVLGGRFLICLPFFTLLGCLTQVIMETEVRVQLENNTSHTITLLEIPGGIYDPPLVLVADTLASGARSRVRSFYSPGRFNLRIWMQPDSTGFVSHDLGRWNLPGGSHYFRLVEENSQVLLRTGRL